MGSVGKLGLVPFPDAVTGGKGVFHKIFCLWTGDVAFFRYNEELEEGRGQSL